MMAVLALMIAAALAAPATTAATPTGPPPPKPTPNGPPPAWAQTLGGATWLSYGSYCWRGTSGSAACVDMIPAAGRNDLASVRVRRGESVRVRLGFPGRSATVTVGAAAVDARLAGGGRSVSWTVRSTGIAIVEIHAAQGSASYIVHLTK